MINTYFWLIIQSVSNQFSIIAPYIFPLFVQQFIDKLLVNQRNVVL